VLIYGDKSAPLCLLDTMAVSEMVLRPDVLRTFMTWSLSQEPIVIPAFSPFTVIELRRRPDLFSAFIDSFDQLVCVLVKGYDQLLEEEIAAYPDPRGIDICAIAYTPLGGPGNRLHNLPWMQEMPQTRAKEDEWNRERQGIVDGMRSLVENFPPSNGDAYSKKQAKEFLTVAGLQQIAMRPHPQSIKVAVTNGSFTIDAFPALKAMLYTVFHKFYVDRTRKASASDAFDVIIAADIPYVEAVITEAHQAEVLKKMKRADGFLDHLRVFTLRDLRAGTLADVA
jgi:hypothetical protein